MVTMGITVSVWDFGATGSFVHLCDFYRELGWDIDPEWKWRENGGLLNVHFRF